MIRRSLFLFAVFIAGCQPSGMVAVQELEAVADSPFDGATAGDERAVAGVKLCWCPAGKFTMGSPRGEPERRPGEDQVEVKLVSYQVY